MKIKEIYVFLIVLFALQPKSSCQETSSIQIRTGLNYTSFYDLEFDNDYKINYKSYSNYIACIAYKEKINTNHYWGVEIANKKHKSNIEIDYYAYSTPFYHNVLYTLNYLDLSLLYEHRIIRADKFHISYTIAPTIGCLIKSHAKGSGWDMIAKRTIDNEGNVHDYTTSEDWYVDENFPDDIKNISVGMAFSIGLNIPLNNQYTLLIDNGFFLSFNNIGNIGVNHLGLKSLYAMLGMGYTFESKH